MPNELDPVIGQWYAHRDKGEMFLVVAVDEASGSVEMQSFDGDVEEVDASAWRDMDIETAEPPEDWTGPYDDIETDDLGMTETDMSTQDWRRSLEPVQQPWQDTLPPDELEEEEGPPLELYAQEVKPADDRAR
ncbi:MAG TPA: DUF6763 family protein [Steroidobacter sp.]|uniref:DUF6763 family protein n=1 Tax=Steroidobacter sp. TaxID=1978227 RepID=UPI002ED8F80C